MNKYRKKPVVIEAVQYTYGNALEVLGWMGMDNTLCQTWDGETLAIPTLEGTMRASVGDYIIKGIRGEYYPCKPDIFYDTYDRVEE